MARRSEPFETKRVRRAKDAEKLIARGWELVSTSGRENWVMGSDYQAILRRPNPRYKEKK